jgi:hypothetical protein
MRWRIYYGDGTHYDGPDPYTAPTRNVQVILTANPDHGWDVCRYDDYYWHLPDLDSWGGGDKFGLFDYLIEPGPKRVLFGRTIANADFQAIFARACADQSLPVKTGWMPRERRSAGIEEPRS